MSEHTDHRISTREADAAPHVERTSWPAAEETRLRILINSGQSAGAAARVLNTEFGTRRSRNAIIGKVHRLGLQMLGVGRNDRQDHQGPRRRPAVTVQHIVEVASPSGTNNIPDVTPAAVNDKKPVALFDLKPRSCHWPIAGMLYCGRRAREGSAYCPEHHMRIYVTARK